MPPRVRHPPPFGGRGGWLVGSPLFGEVRMLPPHPERSRNTSAFLVQLSSQGRAHGYGAISEAQSTKLEVIVYVLGDHPKNRIYVALRQVPSGAWVPGTL